MPFEGRIWRDGERWLVEVPDLGAMTQGRTREDAYEMIKDLVETNEPEFDISIHSCSEDRFEIGANDEKTLVALLLHRQRERRGISLAEAVSCDS